MAHSTELFPIEVDPFFMNDLLQMEKANNYRRWQFDMVAPSLQGDVLEVGGGIGNFTCELASVATSVTSLEPNAYCYARLVEKTKSVPKITARQSTVEALDQHLAADQRFDAIVLMNVLEHIKDDADVLDKLKRRLKPTGRIVVLVPAGSWAFGVIDERLGHYRRYSKRYARTLMAGLGLEIKKMRYYNFIGVWAWYWNARFAKRQSQNDAQIYLFDRYFVPVISRIEKFIPPPVGQSLLIVASPEKKQ